MLICILYLLLCLGVEVFIVFNIIDRLADGDYLLAVCFALYFLIVCILATIVLLATIC